MTKEHKSRREEKKTPRLSLKEKRAKKHEKKQARNEHQIDHSSVSEIFE